MRNGLGFTAKQLRDDLGVTAKPLRDDLDFTAKQLHEDLQLTSKQLRDARFTAKPLHDDLDFTASHLGDAGSTAKQLHDDLQLTAEQLRGQVIAESKQLYNDLEISSLLEFSVASQLTVDILVLLPFNGSHPTGGTLYMFVLVVHDTINEQQPLLPGYAVNSIFLDGQCRDDDTVRKVFETLTEKGIAAPPTQIIAKDRNVEQLRGLLHLPKTHVEAVMCQLFCPSCERGDAEDAEARAATSEGEASPMSANQVPNTYDEMFKFNSAVMGCSDSQGMAEVLDCFDNIATNIAYSARLREEYDTLVGRISSVAKGTVNSAEHKSCVLVFLRSPLPKNWSTQYEVSWSWL